ncbi:tubulin-specific chaperone cofactor E-like protein [Ctenocephalides felis]|uniref:tubulin-specific chaperone cofactor E-like protein n=1 Tax=Ctenocephalides felis TaxID=7515 RepID=UPI000E6E3DD9|nr:tubulin-specific chaperone cofactor E-like protein [Ctenocephalides felis]
MPSLLEALEHKYGGGGPPTNSVETCTSLVSIFVPKRPPRLSVPELLVLNDCDIDAGGDPEQLAEKCGAVRELDLAQNRLRSWRAVTQILQRVPKVEFLNLSFNNIGGTLRREECSLCLQRLRNIVLNNTRVTWTNVRRLLEAMPKLEELHLSLNDYKKVLLDLEVEDPKQNGCNKEEGCCCQQKQDEVIDEEEADDVFENEGDGESRCENEMEYMKAHEGVRKLHFLGNPIRQWGEIARLGRLFPNLESLVVAQCPLQSLECVYNDEGKEESEEISQEDKERFYRRSESDPESAERKPEEAHTYFRNLTFLNLNTTKINDWGDIDRLARFPALRSLRVQNWPLWDRYDVTEHERRQMLLARLPQVSTLNGGGVVDHEEREDAERAFIRHYMDKPESDRPERYSELVSIHGKLDPLVNVDLRPEKRVKVTFTCGDVSEVRSVDVYRTISDLKTRLERLAGFPASRMRLFYVDQDLRDLQGPEEMKFPHKQLYSYNIRSGDEIIIDSKQKH